MSIDLRIDDAAFVLVTDDTGSHLTNASIAIDAGRIIDIGVGVDTPAETVIDARGCLVMPGLVNLHTHLAMTLLRGIAEDVDLQGFLERVWAEEARVMDAQGVRIGTRLGALESLLAGTTTALDMYFHPAAAHESAVDVGLRHVIGPVFFSGSGPDGLEWSERIESARQWPEVLARIGGPYTPVSLMPHAAFTVGVEHLREIAGIAAEIDAMIHVHASENTAENEQTIEIVGMRPIPALNSAGILDQRTVLGHAVRLDDHDREVIRRPHVSVAHCPGSNLKLASGAADIVGYREQGIRVGIGTDGCSSSNDLDMFAAMRLTANLARLHTHDPTAMSAREVLLAATIDGARALGMGDRLGTLEVGKEADIVVVDLDAPHLIPVRDPYTSVVFSAGRSDVRHVVVGGEQVIAHRRSTRVHHRDVMDDAIARVGGAL
jgi:5-methylthioadenosine/S-adenosylhomocysteine deaminase